MSETTVRIRRKIPDDRVVKSPRVVPRPHKVVSNGEPIPKVPLYLAGGVIVFSLVIVFVATLTGVSSYKPQTGAALQQRDIAFSVNSTDDLTVKDATTGKVLSVMSKNEGGFLRGILIATKRERMVQKVAADAPFRVVQSSDGTHTLFDLATGRSFYLRAFGKDNQAAIAHFLTIDKETEPKRKASGANQGETGNAS
ncbi:MAG: photosynthetic complex assembly protein PuhC [Pseudomonadota bacterium]